LLEWSLQPRRFHDFFNIRLESLSALDHLLLHAESSGRFSARLHSFTARALRSEGGNVAMGDSRDKAKKKKSGEKKKGETKAAEKKKS
jgi:hypothetical protein